MNSLPQTSNSNLLEVREVRTWFGQPDDPVRAVDGINFDIARGETLALLGESGCGKSMSALSIMRLVPAPAGRIVSGNIIYDGVDLLGLSETQMHSYRGGRIAMIFQEPMTSLNPVLTVGKQIIEVLRQHLGMKGDAARSRCIELLDDVGIPDPERRINEYPHQLSGGMKQRVMIAIALAAEPDLLIADEPTTALDVTIQAQILELLKDLQKKKNMAMLMITHDLGVVSDFADNIAVMYAGTIVEQADRNSFFSDPKHPYSRKLFDSLPDRNKRGHHLAVIRGSVPSLKQSFSGCRFAERCELATEVCNTTVPELKIISPSHSVHCHHFDRQLPSVEPEKREIQNENISDDVLLNVEDMQVYFPVHKGIFRRIHGYVKAVDGISLQLKTGRTLAIVGESGCGKTTAGKGILQLIRPKAGEVQFNGKNLTQMSNTALRTCRSDMQIIFQDPYSSMNPRMMVGNIIEEGMIIQKKGLSTNARKKRIDQLLDMVGLSVDAKTRYPHEFSGGQRQRICIARALAVEPKLIVCDEPTSALDVSVQAQILNLLKDLQQEMRLSYLLITHNMSVVDYLADELAVMYLGRIVEFGPTEEVMNKPAHPYTRALLSAVPVIDEASKRELIRLEGEMPSPVNPPTGCHFHPRCPQATLKCSQEYPQQTDITSSHPNHTTSCFLYD